MPFARQWCVRRESPVGKGAREEDPGPGGHGTLGGAHDQRGCPDHLGVRGDRRRPTTRPVAASFGVDRHDGTHGRRTRPARRTARVDRPEPDRGEGQGEGRPLPRADRRLLQQPARQLALPAADRAPGRARDQGNTKKGSVIRIALYSFDRIPVAKRLIAAQQPWRARAAAAERPPGHQGDEDAARLASAPTSRRRTSSTSATRAAAPTTASGCCTRSSTRSARPAARSGRCSSARTT